VTRNAATARSRLLSQSPEKDRQGGCQYEEMTSAPTGRGTDYPARGLRRPGQGPSGQADRDGGTGDTLPSRQGRWGRQGHPSPPRQAPPRRDRQSAEGEAHRPARRRPGRQGESPRRASCCASSCWIRDGSTSRPASRDTRLRCPRCRDTCVHDVPTHHRCAPGGIRTPNLLIRSQRALRALPGAIQRRSLVAASFRS
jgi:hypothetical protein